MDYIEVPAAGELAGVASHAWFLAAEPLRKYEKILPLTRAHVIVNLSGPYRIFDRSARSAVVPGEFISGLQSEYLVIESPQVIRHVGIELLPGALHLLAPGFAASSAEKVQDANFAFPGIRDHAANIRLSLDPAAAIDSLLAFFTDRLAGAMEPCVQSVIAALDANPQARIQQLAADAGISQRHLITGFRQATGMTPKRYAQVLRFHRLIDMLSATGQVVDWAKLAVDSGYYDQPHVIRAFRRFSGWTPAEYINLVKEFGAEAAHFVPMDLP